MRRTARLWPCLVGLLVGLTLTLVGGHVIANVAGYDYDAPASIVTAPHSASPASTTPTTPARTVALLARPSPRTSPGVIRPVSGFGLAAKAATGGIGPVLKGQAGVRSSIDEAVSRGERLRGTEVTVEAPSGARVRLDYLTEVDGRLVATEVKTRSVRPALRPPAHDLRGTRAARRYVRRR